MQSLEIAWEELCDCYLPITAEDSMWRYSRPPAPDAPEQGWKLHLTATILSAAKVFERVAPVLHGVGALFKAPRSLLELRKLNCGLFYGYSQVGKFLTVYPNTTEDAVLLADKLHRLTYGWPGPIVPFDCQYRQKSIVHYRYGSFGTGKRADSIQNPAGDLVPDLRKPGAAVPHWVTDPFLQQPHKRQRNDSSAHESPLKTTFRAYEAVSQRGKGGVYRALDLSTLPARLCILKEGRRNGETDWDGRDGYWRLAHEAKVLSALWSAGVDVPRVYATFAVDGNYYMVLEYIEGPNLQSLLVSNSNKIPVKDALQYGMQAAKILGQIHSAGWVWRDCKPLNLIFSKEGVLRPLDFEGACPVKSPDSAPWGTAGYSPPEWLEKPIRGSRVPEDLYALGATLHHSLSGIIPNPTPSLPPIGSLRRGIPPPVRKLISSLLDSDPRSRPHAKDVAYTLELELSHLQKPTQMQGVKAHTVRENGTNPIYNLNRSTSVCEVYAHPQRKEKDYGGTRPGET